MIIIEWEETSLCKESY